MNSNIFPQKFYTSCGFTEIVRPEKGDKIIISHGGNMGNSISSVNENLKILGLPSVEELRKGFPDAVESGSPDYSWSFVIPL